MPIVQEGKSLGTWGAVVWDLRRSLPVYGEAFIDGAGGVHSAQLSGQAVQRGGAAIATAAEPGGCARITRPGAPVTTPEAEPAWARSRFRLLTDRRRLLTGPASGPARRTIGTARARADRCRAANQGPDGISGSTT